MSPTASHSREEPFMAVVTLSDIARPDQWRMQAACRDVDPDLFFPIGATGMAVDQILSAKQVCDLCPVRVACLEYALATNQDSGIWGGTSEEERRALRRQWLRQRRAAAAATVVV
jgi:WhiB family redox-sensing transcriptional regulator